MSDPIKDILRKLDTEMAQAVVAGSGKGLGGYDEVIKQIRQQIGRELLDNDSISEDVEDMWWVERIREVCQLEES